MSVGNTHTKFITADKFEAGLLTVKGDGTGESNQNTSAPQTITSASDGSPNVYTLVAHGRATGEFVFLSGETSEDNSNGLRKFVKLTADTFTLTDPAGTAIDSDGTFDGTVLMQLVFVYKPSTGKTVRVTRMNGYAHDLSYNSQTYFGITLTKGLDVCVYSNDTLVKTLTAGGVKQWPDWSLHTGGDNEFNGDGGVGNQTEGSFRWTFEKAGAAILLESSTHDLIVCILRDNMAGLLGQKMLVQGNLE